MQPSSMGLSFVVDGTATHLQLIARWGRYERRIVELEQYRNKDGQFRYVWQRVPFEATSQPALHRPGRLERWTPDPDRPGVYVDGLARWRDDQWHVT